MNSSWSRHFSIQNVSVSTYLDIMYQGHYEPIFWAQILQRTQLIRMFTHHDTAIAVDFSQ